MWRNTLAKNVIVVGHCPKRMVKLKVILTFVHDVQMLLIHIIVIYLNNSFCGKKGCRILSTAFIFWRLKESIAVRRLLKPLKGFFKLGDILCHAYNMQNEIQE